MLRKEIVRLSHRQVLAMENIEDLPLNHLGVVKHPEFTLKEVLSRYHAALDKLSLKQREIFISLHEWDMSRKEITEQTGLSVHTVNSPFAKTKNS